MHTVPEMQYDVPMVCGFCAQLRGCCADAGGIYPEGMTTLYPIETWSDDFTMAISGIRPWSMISAVARLWKIIIIPNTITRMFMRKRYTDSIMNFI